MDSNVNTGLVQNVQFQSTCVLLTRATEMRAFVSCFPGHLFWMELEVGS